jgi:hypothetical protein
MPTLEFERRMRSIVDDFLQTVVVVDDRGIPSDSLPPSELADPDDLVGGAAAPGGPAITELKEPTGPNSDSHDLDARELIDAFASAGMVCSILDPDDAVGVRLTRTAARADLLVIDWWMNGNRGDRACELIGDVLSADEAAAARRLRVIAIYTGQEDLVGVADKVEGVLDTAYPDAVLDREPDGLEMTKGPVRIVVLAKEMVKLSDPAVRRNRVIVEKLPDRLADEFARLTQGIVSSVGLQALAAVRQDTHRILEKLGPALDRGYLGHRIALREPSDAESHVIEMVTGEIRAVLSASQVGRAANTDAIRAWLRATYGSGATHGALFPLAEPVTESQVVRMLRDGLGRDEALAAQHKADDRSKTELKKIRDAATNLFCDTEAEAEDSDGNFATRMMFRTSYQKPRRRLHLGTIVSRSGKFWICVQPFCDSEGLDVGATGSFPFLPLKDPAKGKVDFVFADPSDTGWSSVALQRNPSDLQLIEFEVGADGFVPAWKDHGRYFFRATEKHRFYWVGELKPDFAQRVAGQLAQQFARVGVDEPEILRRKRGG